ncbi:MAG: hypothetical protein CMK07_09165 [Ponticaulis sp.]|nr:hypothetical protein [Ponticaulis sp.]
MTQSNADRIQDRNWQDTLKEFSQPKMAMMLILGFTAGLPFLLYFSTLSVWMKESGVAEGLLAFFSYFGLAWSFKFLWAPIIDRFDPPGLAKIFGRRRAWIFVAQTSLALAMIGMGFSNPATSLPLTALFSFMIAISSATQDIGVDAWRIEAAANDDEQATLAAAYQYGYKVGMVISGGVALVIAGMASFPVAYWAMAGIVILGAFVFSIWDRKFGLHAAAAAGVLLILVGFASAFQSGAGVAGDGTLGQTIFITLSWLCYAVAALAAIGFVVALVLALKDQSSGSQFSAGNLFKGITFAVGCFLCVALTGAAVGYIIPKIFGALGIQPSRSVIAQGAIYLAAAPLILCAVSIPFIRNLSPAAPILRHPTLAPFLDFFWRHGWIALLIFAFVSSYRLSDFVMGIMAKPAYTQMGYTPEGIGIVSGVYGPWIVFVGVALAGLSALKFGLRTSLILGAIVSVLGNLTFAWLVLQSSESLVPLFIAVTADNIAGGYAGTVFIAFMSTMVAKSFAGTQYAIFSSAYSLGPKLVAGTSGVMVEYFSGGVGSGATTSGYSTFFIVAGLMGIPAIILSIFAKQMKPDRESVTPDPDPSIGKSDQAAA